MSESESPKYRNHTSLRDIRALVTECVACHLVYANDMIEAGHVIQDLLINLFLYLVQRLYKTFQLPS